MTLTVVEASAAYQRAMRNIPRDRSDTCKVCHTFMDPNPSYGGECISCGRQPNGFDLVAPISYSEHGGQLHTALWTYKNAEQEPVRTYAAVRLESILWRYIEDHESCLAAAVGVPGRFDLVTTVPSSDPARDEISMLRAVVEVTGPVMDRNVRLLEPTGAVDGRAFNAERYRAVRSLDGQSILVIDDTWTSGGHSQSAVHVLKEAGAGPVVLVVIGRHLRRGWEPVQDSGVTDGDLFDELPVPFDWDTCVAHEGPQRG